MTNNLTCRPKPFSVTINLTGETPRCSPMQRWYTATNLSVRLSTALFKLVDGTVPKRCGNGDQEFDNASNR